jgi:hypothetical protein
MMQRMTHKERTRLQTGKDDADKDDADPSKFTNEHGFILQVVSLLWVQTRLDKAIGIDEEIFYMPNRSWSVALQFVRGTGKGFAYSFYRKVTANGRIDVFRRLQCSLRCRRFVACTLKWRWLVFQAYVNRGMCNCSYVLWPQYQGQPRIRYHSLVMQALRDASQYPLLRYDDVCGLYHMPVRKLYFNEFDAFCDVIHELQPTADLAQTNSGLGNMPIAMHAHSCILCSLYRPSVRPCVGARVRRPPELVILARLSNISENDRRKTQLFPIYKENKH